MSDLIARIQLAQRDAGERVVMESLAQSGLALASPQEKLQAAKDAAHRALDAAERAWHAYAAQCEVGPDRVAAFGVYDNVRRARCV